MNITVKSKNENSLELLIKNVELSFINSLRRIIIAEIPTLTIDIVKFRSNTTIFPDEFIAHRLGLIPLLFDNVDAQDGTEFILKCTTKPVTTTTTTTRSGSGTGSESGIAGVEEWTASKIVFKNSGINPVYPDIPICKAAAEQEIDIEGIVKKGTGEIHSKWSPVSTCFFRETPDGILFTIESIGSLDPLEILKQAVIILQEKVKKA